MHKKYFQVRKMCQNTLEAEFDIIRKTKIKAKQNIILKCFTLLSKLFAIIIDHTFERGHGYDLQRT